MEITIVNGMDVLNDEFQNLFVNQNIPVVIKGLMHDWPALKNWSPEYFRNKWGNTIVNSKTGNVAYGEMDSCEIGSYVTSLKDEETISSYIHDIPIFNIIPELKEDIGEFPIQLFPKWYRIDILKFAQFFFCGPNGYTPLHFDTLCTHNLFFQIYGEKEFRLINKKHKGKLEMNGWRWSEHDLRDQSTISELNKKGIQIYTVPLDPGDILFIPSQTFHQVNALSTSISFNIDWHSRKSLLRGLLSIFSGAPKENFYYNFLIALGLYFGAPSKYIFPKYKSYLNYIS